MRPRGGKGGSARCGRKWSGYWRKAAQESYQGAQLMAGATTVVSYPRPRTRLEREDAMGKNREKGEGCRPAGKFGRRVLWSGEL